MKIQQTIKVLAAAEQDSGKTGIKQLAVLILWTIPSPQENYMCTKLDYLFIWINKLDNYYIKMDTRNIYFSFNLFNKEDKRDKFVS